MYQRVAPTEICVKNNKEPKQNGSCLVIKRNSCANLSVTGLNKIYPFIVIISSTNKYRKHKSSMLICVLPIDKMIITCDEREIFHTMTDR